MTVKTDKKILTHMLNIPQNKLDKELINMMLKNVVNRVEKQNLYDESAGVAHEYAHLQHSLDSLYSFIYTPHKSNLSLQDAQVFASYVVQQSKKLNDIVNVLTDNKMKVAI